MPPPTDLAQAKRRLSSRLLADEAISGVGIRDDALVVYLAVDDEGVRRRVRQAARDLASDAPVVFEVTGTIRKQ